MKNLTGLLIIVIFIIVLTGTSNHKDETRIDPPNNKDNHANVKNVAQEINEKKRVFNFKEVKVLNFRKNAGKSDETNSFVDKATLLDIDLQSLSGLIQKKEENILFIIPVSGKSSIELELTRSYPTSPDFILKSKDGTVNHIKNYTPGLHYKGIVKGKENSLASISIFNDFIMGIISDENGNYVLGSIKNQDNTYSEKYIFYNDVDMNIKNNFKCGVVDEDEKFIMPIDENKISSNDFDEKDNVARLPVKVYFEADYQMYVDAGMNDTNLVNFITGMFNSVMTIYQNESIPIVISQISYWASSDPYSNIGESYNILTSFGSNTRDDFQASIAHLISTRTDNLGGIAWIRVLCQAYNAQDSAGRYAFSNIEPGYNNYPTYSWTVNVVAHEMGHSMGSRHTHACVWPINGTIKAIDSCYYAEGGCFSNSQIRPTIGTMMSYCHLWPVSQGGGVNLASGFGPLPGDTIRLRYLQAACFDALLNSSEQPSAYDLAQNFPNPFNPSTKISFALPVDANVSLKIYDISGRSVAELVSNKFYPAGFYNLDFNSSGYGLSSGIYFYSLISDGKLIDTKRMVLIK